MGEINLSELPTLKVEAHGLPLPVGLRNVPFLIGTGPTTTAEITELTFALPIITDAGADFQRVQVDVPTILVQAWINKQPHDGPSIAEQLEMSNKINDSMSEALERAERQDQQKTRIGDYLAHVLEMTNRFMGDERRAIVAIPKSQISIGDMIASAVAWWDKGRHDDAE